SAIAEATRDVGRERATEASLCSHGGGGGGSLPEFTTCPHPRPACACHQFWRDFFGRLELRAHPFIERLATQRGIQPIQRRAYVTRLFIQSRGGWVENVPQRLELADQFFSRRGQTQLPTARIVRMLSGLDQSGFFQRTARLTH